MAEKKSGPVRPPTLEGSARRTSATRKTAATRSKAAQTKTAQTKAKSDATPTDLPKPDQSEATPEKSSNAATSRPNTSKARPALSVWLIGLISALLGGLLGAAAILVLWISGAASSLLPAPQDAGARAELESLRGRIVALEQSTRNLVSLPEKVTTQSDINQQNFSQLQTQLDNFNATLSAEISGLQTDLDNLTATPNPVNANQNSQILADLQQQITDLEIALNARTAAANAPEGPTTNSATTTSESEIALASLERLEALRTQLDALTAQMSATSQSLEDLDAQSASVMQLQASEDNLQRQIEDLTNKIAVLTSGQVTQSALADRVQVPLAISAIEDALSRGTTFSSHLSALQGLLPTLDISTTLAQAAETGLPNLDQLANDLTRAAPEMIAASPTNADAPLPDQIFSAVKNLFAVRSAAGETAQPGTLISMAETALANRDSAQAASLLAQLPHEAQAVAPALITSISAHAEAETLLSTARQSSLSNLSAGVPAPIAEPIAEPTAEPLTTPSMDEVNS